MGHPLLPPRTPHRWDPLSPPLLSHLTLGSQGDLVTYLPVTADLAGACPDTPPSATARMEARKGSGGQLPAGACPGPHGPGCHCGWPSTCCLDSSTLVPGAAWLSAPSASPSLSCWPGPRTPPWLRLGASPRGGRGHLVRILGCLPGAVPRLCMSMGPLLPLSMAHVSLEQQQPPTPDLLVLGQGGRAGPTGAASLQAQAEAEAGSPVARAGRWV